MARELKYEQVKQTLRECLRKDYRVGEKIPSTAQLHKSLGVSPQTVNRAISDLVEEGLLVRQARRGTFLTRPGSLTDNIGFVCPALPETLSEVAPFDRTTWPPTHAHYMATALHGAEAEASRLGRRVLMVQEVDLVRPRFSEDRKQVAGVIVVFNRDPRTVEAYHAQGIPVVLIDPYLRVQGVPFVTSDHCASVREMIQLLTNQGHRRIVYVTVNFPGARLVLEECVLGYEAAMREAGLEDAIHVHRIAYGMEKERMDAAVIEMLDTVRPTACLCCNDDAAAGVARICHEEGIDVPGDISVAGFDRSGIGEHVSPPLTTVRVPMESFGQAAVRILDQLIENHTLTGESVILPAYVVERASTGRAPSREQAVGAGFGGFDGRTEERTRAALPMTSE